MSINSDYQKLEPGNSIRLFEVDGTAFGAEDVLRFHNYSLPHTEQEIADAANIVRRRPDFSEVTVAGGIKIMTMTGFIVRASGTGTIFGINGGGFDGDTYQAFSVEYRVLSEPGTTNYLVNYVSAVHGFSSQYQKTGSRIHDSEAIGDGWYRLTVDMSRLSTGGGDWLNSKVNRVRIALWNGGSTGEIEVRTVRFINYRMTNIDESKLPAKSVWWQGVEYKAWPCDITGLEASTSGSNAQPKLSVANLDGSVTALCLAYDDLMQAKVSIRDTLAQYLDACNFPAGNATADPTQEKMQVFYVDAKSSETTEAIVFTLSSPMDLQGLMIPTRQLHSLCTWCIRGQYRSGDGCDYSGNAFFDKYNRPVGDPSQDECPGTLSACKIRFGADNPLPFGGFPGTSLLKG